MKKSKCIQQIIFAILLSITSTIHAQTVEILNTDSTLQLPKQKSFTFLQSQTDTNSLKFVATIKVTREGEDVGLDFMFNKIKKVAQNMGANTFKLNAYNKIDSLGINTFLLDIYYASDSILEKNSANNQKNIVYVFGNPNKINHSTSFKIDGNKKEIKGGTYFKYILDTKQEVKINKGGLTGVTVWIKWKENKPATFLTLTGFGVGGGAVPPPGQLGITFNTGRINYIDPDFGRLLISLLPEGE